MRYKKYMDDFFIEKNLVIIQIIFWISLFSAFNTPNHTLYHNKFALVLSFMPTCIGLIVGTIQYFKENKK